MNMREAAHYCRMSPGMLRRWRSELGLANPERIRVHMTGRECDALLLAVKARKAARNYARQDSLPSIAQSVGLTVPTLRTWGKRLGLWQLGVPHLRPADGPVIAQARELHRAQRHAAAVARNREKSRERYQGREVIADKTGVYMAIGGAWQRVG